MPGSHTHRTAGEIVPHERLSICSQPRFSKQILTETLSQDNLPRRATDADRLLKSVDGLIATIASKTKVE